MSVVTKVPDVASSTAPRALAPGSARSLVANTSVPGRSLRRLVQAQLIPYVSRQVHSFGRTGVAGAALTVFALAFFFGANSPLKNQLADMQSTLDSAQSSHANLQSATAPAAQSDLKAFVTSLPTRAELPTLTGQIVAQAATAGISLERGTYDFTITSSGQMVRARMSFPVHGRYPDIRHFIDGTLAAVPGAAVDALRFERKSVGDTEIDAEVRFAIFLKAGK